MSFRTLVAWMIALQGCAAPAPKPADSPPAVVTAPQDVISESTPAAQDDELIATPWNVSFSDGNANQFRFWRDDPDLPARFEYTPVQPIHSSSGIYSGGEPREGELTPSQSEELWVHVEAITAATEHHVEQRMKGTVVVEAVTAEHVRRVIVASGDAREQFASFVEQFRHATPE